MDWTPCGAAAVDCGSPLPLWGRSLLRRGAEPLINRLNRLTLRPGWSLDWPTLRTASQQAALATAAAGSELYPHLVID